MSLRDKNENSSPSTGFTDAEYKAQSHSYVSGQYKAAASPSPKINLAAELAWNRKPNKAIVNAAISHKEVSGFTPPEA